MVNADTSVTNDELSSPSRNNLSTNDPTRHNRHTGTTLASRTVAAAVSTRTVSSSVRATTNASTGATSTSGSDRANDTSTLPPCMVTTTESTGITTESNLIIPTGAELASTGMVPLVVGADSANPIVSSFPRESTSVDLEAIDIDEVGSTTRDSRHESRDDSVDCCTPENLSKTTSKNEELSTGDDVYDSQSRFYKLSLGATTGNTTNGNGNGDGLPLVHPTPHKGKGVVDGTMTMAKQVSPFDEVLTDEDDAIHVDGKQLVVVHTVYDGNGQTIPLPMQEAHGETSNAKELTMAGVHRQRGTQKLWLVCAILTLVLALIVTIIGTVMCSDGQCYSVADPVPPALVETIAPTPVPHMAASPNLTQQVYEYLNNITLTRQNFTRSTKGNANETKTPEETAIEMLLQMNHLDLTLDTASKQFRWRQRYALACFLAHQASIDSLEGDECEWVGVECQEQNMGPEIGVQNVTVTLNLPVSQMKGPIPIDLGLLSTLLHVNVSFNALTGSLPYSIGRWSNIANFSVGSNQLNGSLPDSIALWTDLKLFDVGPNKLTGTLPSLVVPSWSKLKHFNVMINAMNGSLPDNIARWTNMEYFSIFANKWWVGSLPASIGQWTNLTYFDAGWNHLTGSLPESIGQWTNLQTFSVGSNFFTGTMPESIGNWTSILRAYFNGNNFSGWIPDRFCAADTLPRIHVDMGEVECPVK